MKNVRIFKRESGLKVRVESTFYVESYRQEFRYSSHVSVCEKRKRTYRAPMDDSEKVTAEELLETQMELWEMMKPKSIEAEGARS